MLFHGHNVTATTVITGEETPKRKVIRDHLKTKPGELVTCPICETLNARKHVETETYVYKGHKLIVKNVKYYSCNLCSISTIDPEYDDELDHQLDEFQNKINKMKEE